VSLFRNIIIILLIVFLGLILIGRVTDLIAPVLKLVFNLAFIAIVILAIIYLVKKLRS